MKTAVSIPDSLFASAETIAKRLGLSRSALYARALGEFVASRRRGAITRRLNVIYAKDPSCAKLDQAIRRMQAATLRR